MGRNGAAVGYDAQEAGLPLEGDDASGRTSWGTSEFDDETLIAVADPTLPASHRLEQLQAFLTCYPSPREDEAIERLLAAALSPWTLSEDHVDVTEKMRESASVIAEAVQLVLVQAWDQCIFKKALTHVFSALSPFVNNTGVQSFQGELHLLGTISVAVSTRFDMRDGVAASCWHWMSQHHAEAPCDERMCFALLRPRFVFLGVLFGIRRGVYETLELSMSEGLATWADDVLKSAAYHGATCTLLALKQVAPLGLDACSVCQRLVLDGLPPSSVCTMAAGIELLTIVMRGAARNARPDASWSEPDSFFRVRKAAVRVQTMLTRLRPGGRNRQDVLARDHAHLVNTALLAWLSFFEGTTVWQPFNVWGLALSTHVLRSYTGAHGDPNKLSCEAACSHAKLLWEQVTSN